MRIPRVHVDESLEIGAEVRFGAAQIHYLMHVLRLQPGATVHLFNGREALDFVARVEFRGRLAIALVDSVQPAAAESPLLTQIIQGLARADHVDWMLQKTTELGVNRVVLFNAARTQTPLKGARLEKKLAHWRGVTISACEQCGRARLPQIEFHRDLHGALAATIPGHRILLDFEGLPLPSLLEAPSSGLALLLGPEGGLDSGEIQQAREAGYTSARLGPRVLRTETAAVTALAVAQSLRGDLA